MSRTLIGAKNPPSGNVEKNEIKNDQIGQKKNNFLCLLEIRRYCVSRILLQVHSFINYT